MTKNSYCLLFFALIALMLSALMQPSYAQSENSSLAMQVYNLPNKIARYLPIHEITQIDSSTWQKAGKTNLLQADKNWLLITISNPSKRVIHSNVVINAPLQLSEYAVYYHRDQELLTKSLIKEPNHLLHSELTIFPEQTVNLYLELQASSAIPVDIQLLTAEQLNHRLSQEMLFTGAALGLLAALVLVMLVIFIATHKLVLLFLASYFALLTALLSLFLGIEFIQEGFAYLELAHLTLPILMGLACLFLLLMTSRLFNLKYQDGYGYRAYQVISALLLIYILLSPFYPVQLQALLSQVSSFIVFVLLLLFGIYGISQKLKLSPLFTLTIAIHLSFMLSNIVVYGWQVFNAPLYTLAFCLHGMLISYILSKQYTFQIKEKDLAQQEALESAMISKNSQEELLALQNESQEQLEQRVQERTLELNIALQELEEANRELEQKNTIDELTGLYNRRFYDQKIVAEYRRSRRNLTPLSLIIIDIDHFKRVNDDYGHLTGDKCLVELSQRIKHCLRRSTDVGCRYGGEEFCVILPETDNQGAQALADEIRQTVANQGFEISKTPLNITISCGVSTYQQEKDATPEQLFFAADKALYQAKHNGRNQVRSCAIAVDQEVITEEMNNEC